MASKVFTIIYGAELGKFVVLPNILGRSSVRNYESAASRRYDKKRMSVCNRLNRGSKFASTWKSADLSLVFRCMNSDKPRNVRRSITLKSEILTDT